jgi:hypothetical protein
MISFTHSPIPYPPHQPPAVRQTYPSEFSVANLQTSPFHAPISTLRQTPSPPTSPKSHAGRHEPQRRQSSRQALHLVTTGCGWLPRTGQCGWLAVEGRRLGFRRQWNGLERRTLERLIIKITTSSQANRIIKKDINIKIKIKIYELFIKNIDFSNILIIININISPLNIAGRLDAGIIPAIILLKKFRSIFLDRKIIVGLPSPVASGFRWGLRLP